MNLQHEQQRHNRETKELVELAHEELAVLRNIYHDVHKILHVLIQPKQLTAAIAVRFIGANMQPNNVCVLNVGQTAPANILGLLADGITPSGGTISNAAYNFSDPSATVVLNSDGLTATVTGVAASNGPISGSASCTVTDTDGTVSQWTQNFTVQTNGGGGGGQLTQSIAVQFGDPVGGVSPSTGKFPGLGTPVGQRSR